MSSSRNAVREMTPPTGPQRPERFADVVRRLTAAQKSAKGAPAYSRFVNRPLGRRLAAGAHLMGLTPNVVTLISALFSFTAIALIALVSPSWWSAVAVAVALVLGYALDSADGQLARLRGGGSHSGEWLDHMVDAAKITSLHLAVLIGAYRFFDLPAAWLLVPIAFVLVANTMFFGMILNDLLRARLAARTGTPVQRTAPSTLRSLLVVPTDYGLLCVLFVLLGAPMVFFGAYTVVLLANAGFLLLASVKWFRDMQQLDRIQGDKS